MENAAEALKMAAAILIFVIAIACSFSLFGTAKQTADSIITMRDKQAYLEADELDNGVLYTSYSAIQGETGLPEDELENGLGVNQNGDRIVNASDVISTIYRYSKEKYGVTIIQKNGNKGKVLARFDSITETQYIKNWDKRTLKEREIIAGKIEENLTNDYVTVSLNLYNLQELYTLKNENNQTVHGENWYGNDKSIMSRINADISGGEFKNNGLTYKGKGLLNILKDKKIVEVTNEIDESKYLEDNEQATNLLQQYSMPTVEIIYIVY